MPKEDYFTQRTLDQMKTTQLSLAKIATDLFELKGVAYRLVDYLSCLPEVAKLTSTTSATVISALNNIFSQYEIPEVLISDNGPQFIASEMKAFASSYSFEHITSSPHYPQSNVQAEHTVKTVKPMTSVRFY